MTIRYLDKFTIVLINHNKRNYLKKKWWSNEKSKCGHTIYISSTQPTELPPHWHILFSSSLFIFLSKSLFSIPLILTFFFWYVKHQWYHRCIIKHQRILFFDLISLSLSCIGVIILGLIFGCTDSMNLNQNCDFRLPNKSFN